MKKLIPEVDGWFGIEGFLSLPALFEALDRGKGLHLLSHLHPVYGSGRKGESHTTYLALSQNRRRLQPSLHFLRHTSHQGPYRSRSMESVVNEARDLQRMDAASLSSSPRIQVSMGAISMGERVSPSSFPGLTILKA